MEGSNTVAYPFCAVLQAFPWYNVLVAGLLAQVISSGNHRQFQRSRQRMRTPIRRRQLRGLVLHHRRHPAEHPRRLVNRTASWEDPPVNGVCRWCYELTASPQTRWHRYCLNIYRVASGQYPDEIQHTLCEICGNPSDEMDHRLAIEVARALWAQLRCYARSRRRTCSGCAATATGARPGRTGNLRSSCRAVRWTGTAHGDYSVRTGSSPRTWCKSASS